MAWQGSKPTDFTDTVRKDAEREVKKVALGLAAALVRLTPVDTGRARSNWITTDGAPTDAIVEENDKSGAPSIKSAEAVQPKLGRTIFINNNLPYIGWLNNGTDNMKAFNMIPRAIAAVKRALK